MLRYVLQPSSGISCRTREPIQNFKRRPLFYSRGFASSNSVNNKQTQALSIVTHLQSGLNLQPPDNCHLEKPSPIITTPCVLLDSLVFLHHYELLVLCMIFCLGSYHEFFYLIILIISSHIVFIPVLGLPNKSLWPNICADSLRRLMLQCSSLSIILTSSHKSSCSVDWGCRIY